MDEGGEDLDLNDIDFPPFTLPTQLPPVPLLAPPPYFPTHATPFTPEQRAAKLHKLNHSTALRSSIVHPLYAVLEYPETSEAKTDKIAHIFTVDPAYPRPPKSNIQYSLDHKGSDGRSYNCEQLRHPDDRTRCATGRTEWLHCTYSYFTAPRLPLMLMLFSGKGVKCCTFHPQFTGSHTFVTPTDLDRSNPARVYNAEREVFEKTLALWTSVLADGCNSKLKIKLGPPTTTSPSASGVASPEPTLQGSAPSTTPSRVGSPASTNQGPDADNADGISDGSSSDSPDSRLEYRSKRDRRPLTCRGKILLKKDQASDRFYLWCVTGIALCSAEVLMPACPRYPQLRTRKPF